METEAQRLLDGDSRALARLITMLEQGDPQVIDVLRHIVSQQGKAYCVGITGPPGAGKSTLVSALTRISRGEGLMVGILAVDPSSPFSGGALLGDRIRMRNHYLDSGVFIRSMSTRGAHGGLPRVIKSVVRLLDAAGKDMVLVETAGVGQTELAVMDVADTVVVVLDPEAGDAIQTLKAGLLEIADILVVNKADREGADRLVAALRATVTMNRAGGGGWTVPVLKTVATKGEGTEELDRTVQEHRESLRTSGKLEEQRKQRRTREFMETVEARMLLRLRARLAQSDALKGLMEQVGSGSLDPYAAALDLPEDLLSV